MSGSEPRIFPGVVSRSQRRGSTARQSSMSETDDVGGTGKKVHGKGRNGKGGGEPAFEEVMERSDWEMEETGGSDE